MKNQFKISGVNYMFIEPVPGLHRSALIKEAINKKRHFLLNLETGFFTIKTPSRNQMWAQTSSEELHQLSPNFKITLDDLLAISDKEYPLSVGKKGSIKITFQSKSNVLAIEDFFKTWWKHEHKID